MWKFRGRDELERFLNENDIMKDDICIIGGLVFNAYGLRQHGDIDFIAKKNIVEKLTQNHEIIHDWCDMITVDMYGEECDIKINRFLPLGYEDDEIINRAEYHIIFEGFKVLRLELAYGIRIIDAERLNGNYKANRDCFLCASLMAFRPNILEDTISQSVFEELKLFLQENNIANNSYAVTNAFDFYLDGIRKEYGKIAIVVDKDCFEGLKEKYKLDKEDELLLFDLHGKGVIEIAKDKFVKVGISDDEVFTKYCTLINGFSIVRLELILQLRNLNLSADSVSQKVERLGNYALDNEVSFDWTLIGDAKKVTASPLHHPLFDNGIAWWIYRLRPGNWWHLFWHWGPKLVRRIFWPFKSHFAQLVGKMKARKDLYGLTPATVVEPINVFMKQINESQQFDAYDTVVRYGFVEEELCSYNAILWHDLYKKMQTGRGFYDSHNDSSFKALLKNVQVNNINYNMPISLSKDGMLLDGSHRLATSLYMGFGYIGVKGEKSRESCREFDQRWFRKIGYSEQEICLLICKKNEIMYKRGGFFPINIWPAAVEYADEIENIIKDFGVPVVYKSTIVFEKAVDLAEYMWGIYNSDDIDEWKIARKIAFLSRYPGKVIVFWMQIQNPKYRRKVSNGNYLSTTCEEIKDRIRSIYRGKIDNYIYDIICHIGDNYSQNEAMNRVISNYTDIEYDKFTNTID